jgi:mono/diheme cytochrome c family protein
VDPVALRKRQRLYLPVAGVLALFMLLGVYGFVNAEQTAITTVERQEPTTVVFVPWTSTPAPTQTPTAPATETSLPSATPNATQLAAGSATPGGASSLTWDSAIGAMLQAKCASCHGAGALGGLNLSTYSDAMQGGNSGSVIIPGDGANSLLVIRQQTGDHPGQLTEEELAQMIEWIDAGALEK